MQLITFVAICAALLMAARGVQAAGLKRSRVEDFVCTTCGRQCEGSRGLAVHISRSKGVCTCIERQPQILGALHHLEHGYEFDQEGPESMEDDNYDARGNSYPPIAHKGLRCASPRRRSALLPPDAAATK